MNQTIPTNPDPKPYTPPKPYDFASVIPAAYLAAVPQAKSLAAGGKGVDVGAAVVWALQNKALIQQIVDTIKGLFGKKSTPSPGVPAVPATPTPTTPPVTSTPGTPATPPAPTGEARRIAALKASYRFITRKNAMRPNSGRHIIAVDEFEAILSGANPLQAGDNVAVDITPVDQFGREFQPGDAANALQLGPDGQPRYRYHALGVAEVNSIADPGNPEGNTPVLHVPWNDGKNGSEVKPGFQGELGLTVELQPENLTVALPTLRVRPWAV